jgi:hypothetical protein
LNIKLGVKLSMSNKNIVIICGNDRDLQVKGHENFGHILINRVISPQNPSN